MEVPTCDLGGVMTAGPAHHTLTAASGSQGSLVEGDGIPDHIEADRYNITEQQNNSRIVKSHNETSIGKQFNPLVRENTPQTIGYMSVE